MLVGIVTSRNARPIIERVLEEARRAPELEGVDAVIVELPIPAIGHLTTEAIATLLERNPMLLNPKGRRPDILLVPGGCKGSTRIIEEKTGIPTFKASNNPGFLVEVLKALLRGEELSREESFEEPVRGGPQLAIERVAFKILEVPVPARGPPLLLTVEIPPEISVDSVEEYYSRITSEGAQIVVLGSASFNGMDETLRKARLLSGLAGASRIPLLCELPTPRLARQLSEFCDGFSVSTPIVNRLVEDSFELKDKAFIVGDKDTNKLASALELLRGAGATRLIADPVVGLPLIDMSSTVDRYREASKLGVPLLFSAANITEELAADTHGVHALLASLAVELGASLYLVVESRYYSRHSTSEAREAIRLASSAYAKGATPLEPWSRLLVVKEYAKPVGVRIREGEYELFAGGLKPVMDKGYFIVEVDYENGLLGVKYYENNRLKRAWAARDALTLMRLVLRNTNVSLEHAGYLGYELHKAELALRLGKTYTQDSEVIVPPWWAGHGRNG